MVSRSSTVEHVTKSIVGLVSDVNDPVIVRVGGNEIGLTPQQLKVCDRKRMYIRRTTVAELRRIRRNIENQLASIARQHSLR